MGRDRGLRRLALPPLRLAVHAERAAGAWAGPVRRRRRFAALGGRRADAMVLDRNELAQHTWRATGYGPQPQWSRWVKPLTD
ncbi:N-acetyltransferase OS=Streptomyces microflavus OX=1919 GN=Smic_06120 PE=4 SV=1 [Streptomyces microflavus]